MRRWTVLFLVIPLLVSCVSVGDSSPSWITQPYDAHYPEEKYLIVIGSGSSYEGAIENARTNLAYVFSSSVESNLLITSSDSTDGTFYEEFFELGSISSSVENVFGSEVISSAQVGDSRWYVRLALDRIATTKLYRQQIHELSQEIQRIRSRLSGDPLMQYSNLLSAYPLAVEADALANRVWVLTKESTRAFALDLQSELRRLASAIRVDVVVHGSSGAEVLKAGFINTLSDLGFERGSGEYVLTITYDSEAEALSGSPYAYERYTLTASVEHGLDVIQSFTVSERITAMEQRAAANKALQRALELGRETFMALLGE